MAFKKTIALFAIKEYWYKRNSKAKRSQVKMAGVLL
jgi:hypothetical protein